MILNTIISNRQVIDKGRIVEFDTPTKLIENKGYFYNLAKKNQ